MSHLFPLMPQLSDNTSSIKPSKVEVPHPGLDLKALTVENDISHLRMREAYDSFVIDEQAAIPLSIRMLENPKSPIALPGSISLQGHDYVHLLLNRGISLYDEGFVVGFTMGNSDQLRSHHLAIYKFLAQLIFPKKFRFNRKHLKAFELGVLYGQQLPHKNIHQVNFEHYTHLTIGEVRRLFSIDLEQLKTLWKAECLLLSDSAAVTV